jgi:hypothetical protein
MICSQEASGWRQKNLQNDCHILCVIMVAKNPIYSTYVQTAQRMSEMWWPTGWMAGVQFPAEVRDFSPLRSVQTGSEAHPASYSMGTQDSFPGG